MFFFKKLFSGEQPPFKQLVDAGALIIDVRSNDEYDGGHIRNSINIPLDNLHHCLKDIKSRQQTVITTCRSGMRSGVAQGILAAGGIKAFDGGAWIKLEKLLQ